MNDQKYLQEAIAIISESDLQQEEKNMWETQLSGLNEDALKLFNDLFKNDKELLSHTTKSLQQKIAAGDDDTKITDLIEQERKELLDAMLNS